MMTSKDWEKLIFIVSVCIMFLVGFIVGYFYVDKSCVENPLSYGIQKLNEINQDQIVCSCSSAYGKVKPFYVDKDGIRLDFLELD